MREEHARLAPPRTPSLVERRKHVRQPVSLPCSVDVTTTSGAMQITDLSVSGCFVATAQPVAVGTRITLQTTLANTDVALEGRVVHVQPGCGFAVEFAKLPEEARRLLARFLQNQE